MSTPPTATPPAPPQPAARGARPAVERSSAAAWLWSGAALALAAVGGLTVGPASLGGDALLDGLGLGAGSGDGLDAIVRLRAVRSAGAALSGAALGLAGLLLQTATRNPLADPYLLGTSAGATLSTVGLLTLASTLGVVGLVGTAEPVLALVGALLAATLAIRIGQRAGGTSERVVLAGLVITAFAGAATSLLLVRADDAGLRAATQWLMGGVSVTSPLQLALPALGVVAGLLWTQRRAAQLDALRLGVDSAAGLGVDAARIERGAVLFSAILAAVAVAIAGIVGFVGLLVPHGARALFGPGHRHLAPATCLGGGAFLLAVDLLCRVAFAPAELPIGIPTALAGVPLLLVLLRRRDRPLPLDRDAAATQDRRPRPLAAAGLDPSDRPPPTDRPVPLLACRQLSVAYAGQPVLRELDLELAPGRLVAVLGANGAGKSTLLRALAGAGPGPHRPERSGTILDRGVARADAATPNHIAWLPQRIELDDEMTTDELVDLAGRLDGLPRRARAELRARALARVDAQALADRPLGTLSGGQRQRAVLALALARPASVLLLDEPTAALDVVAASEVLGTLARIAHEERRLVVVTAHDLVAALAVADDIVILVDGQAVRHDAGDDAGIDDALRRAFGDRVLALLGRIASLSALPTQGAQTPTAAQILQAGKAGPDR